MFRRLSGRFSRGVIDTGAWEMKTLLQFAFATIARIDRGTLRSIWATIERIVSGFERTKFQDERSGEQKLDYVLERVSDLVPENRKEIGSQIIRAIVEIVLIGLRIKGLTK